MINRFFLNHSSFSKTAGECSAGGGDLLSVYWMWTNKPPTGRRPYYRNRKKCETRLKKSQEGVQEEDKRQRQRRPRSQTWMESHTEDSGPVRRSNKQRSDLNTGTKDGGFNRCECTWWGRMGCNPVTKIIRKKMTKAKKKNWESRYKGGQGETAE